jgi:putative oxidoreductase
MLFPELTSLADWGFLGLRIAVGIIFVVHGWPKITGAPAMAAAFGREGDRLTIAWMTGQGLVEAIGGVALILGVLTQLVALAFMIIMIGAIGLKLTLWRTGFMAQQTTGWEFDFVLLFASLLLFLAGPGQLALMAGGVTG